MGGRFYWNSFQAGVALGSRFQHRQQTETCTRE
jgi:hypothetical protein